MKKVLAISGGVDSMVLLHLFLDDPEIVVAHFNHGTRTSAETDEKFIKRFCEERGLEFFAGRANLGENVSEEKAREARYSFLRKVAFENKAEIYTAHHVDDLVETVTINFLRGTGHRGLAPMSAIGVRRPLLEKGWSKKDILKYAAENNVEFREDPTNSSDEYLRNRVRKNVRELSDETKQKIFELFKKQKEIEREIDEILENSLPEDNNFERKWFFDMEENLAVEILRFALIKGGISATRPQILDFLNAIKTYQPHKKFNLPNNKLVEIGKKDFRL